MSVGRGDRRFNQPLLPVGGPPTQKGYVQVELARRTLRSMPICAWYTELATKPLLLRCKSAFVQNVYRSRNYSITAVENRKGGAAFLPAYKCGGLSPRFDDFAITGNDVPFV